MQRHVFIKTYGCQMNAYDSGRMMDVLGGQGFQETQYPERADLIILNTCHIREKASEKLFSDLGRLKRIKKARGVYGTETMIAVAGCVPQAEGDLIAKRAPYVDIILGPGTYHRLPEMLDNVQKNRDQGHERPVVDIDFPEVPKFDFLPAPLNQMSASAFVSIQEGCDKFCTFCVVPYTRGAEYSRPVMDVVKEVTHLAQNGIMEITLLGQNVTAYHGAAPDGKGEWSIASLILKLADIEGIERIRYTTSHPRDMQYDLVAVHASCSKLMPFLHLPVQSGSDSILKAMNRKHTVQDYMNLLEAFRGARPDMGFSSDFIVGFPGESDEDFEATLGLVRKVGFAQAYSFMYSPRPGTPASLIEDQVEEQTKRTRLKALQDLMAHQQLVYNQSMVGKTMPVLFERLGKKPHQYVGRSPYMQSVHVEIEEDILGQLCNTVIIEAYQNSLKGAIKK